MKKYMQWVVIPALFVAFMVPAGAHAQTYTTTSYQSTANQQQIAYLYALVAQLQAQLNALLAAGATSHSSYVTISSETVSDAKNDSVEFSGTASVQKSGTVRVWFEYGTTMAVEYSTESRSKLTLVILFHFILRHLISVQVRPTITVRLPRELTVVTLRELSSHLPTVV
jgi:hypothetical protein